MNHMNHALVAVLVGASLSVGGCAVDGQPTSSSAASAETPFVNPGRTLSDFLRYQQASMTMKPEVDLAAGRVRFVTSLPLEDGTLKMVFRLDVKDPRVAELYRGWDEAKTVRLEWAPVFAKVEGLEAREVQIRWQDVQGVMNDPTARTICGTQKVLGKITMVIDGERYSGSMKMGFRSHSYLTGEPVDSNAADFACEDHSFVVIDWCDDTCKFIMPAGPQVSTTCTLGGVVGGMTATGTAFGGAGGAEIGVLATTTAACWNEFDGKCKLVDAWFGDYCVCAPEGAPNLHCNPHGDPCSGSAGGSCSTPSWSCGGGGTPPRTDAGVLQVTDAGVRQSQLGTGN